MTLQTIPDVLTVAQLAELLDCTEQTVQERTRERALPGVKFGRDWVYPRDAVLRVLNDVALAHVKPVAPAPATGGQVQPLRAVPTPVRPKRARGRSPAPLPDPPGLT